MSIPESLQRKIDLFARGGRFFRDDDELFIDANWTAVFLGQRIWPSSYDPLVDAVDLEDLKAKFQQLQQLIRAAAESMPQHADFISHHCAAPKDSAGTHP